jgi:thioredoxin 1
MAEDIMNVNDSNFDSDILKADKPALVDFWAAWCGPCKAIAPVIEELVKNYSDKLVFAKCNVDENPVTPSKYGIQAIPTLIFFKDGEIVDRITGMVPKSKIEEAIKKLI